MPITLPDLHGRSDLLAAALEYHPPEATFVFLGDAIDRGPDSMGVVRRLLALSDAGRVTLLRGNHEAMLAEAAENHRLWRESGEPGLLNAALDHFENWLRNGGTTVLHECGGFGPAALPPELAEYISRTVYSCLVEVGPEAAVLCAHAAPPVSLPQYGSPEVAALWARPNEGPFPLPPGVSLSVHGHTPLDAPTLVGRHLYTDLGAVFSGALCTLDLESLTAVVLQGEGEASLEDLPQLTSEAEGLVRAFPYRLVEL